MSTTYKPPSGPPPSAGSLAKYVLAYARANSLTEGRVRAWISYMITAGILEHATTLPPRPGKRNERFRDLINLLLIQALAVEYQDLCKTCEQVFAARNTHPWPPPLELPEHWSDPVNRLIRELQLPIADVHAGLAQVSEFVDRIISSTKGTDGNLR